MILISAFTVSCTTLNQASNKKMPQNPMVKKSSSLKLDNKIAKSDLKKQQFENSDLKIFATPQRKLSPHYEVPSAMKSFTEGQMFGELQDKYESKNIAEFESYYMVLINKFPFSKRVDEAHYMKGLLELSNKNYGESLEALNKILKNSKNSKTAPLAIYAKSQLYRNMNLMDESKNMLVKICSLYPGSPEASKARSDLRLLK